MFILGPVRFFRRNVPSERQFRRFFFLRECGFRYDEKKTRVTNPSEYYWSEHTVVTKIRNRNSLGLDQKNDPVGI